jgi:hypothetical protein
VVALGDDLGAEQHVDLAALHRGHEVGGGAGGRDRVAGHHGQARLGQEVGHLLGQALHAGAGRDEAGHGAAGGAVARLGHGEAAVVALEAAAQAVGDEPGGAGEQARRKPQARQSVSGA